MFRWIRRELAGMARSLRYDLGRRRDPARQRTEVLHPEYDAYRRPPRRWYAAIALGAVVAAAVAAVYVGVAGGLGALLNPVVDAVPGLGSVAPTSHPTGTWATAQPSITTRVPAPSHSTPGRHPSSAPATTGAVPAAVTGTGGEATPSPLPTCQCPTPVPTPESPHPTPSDSPSAAPSPSVSHSPTPTSSGSTGTQS